MWKDITDIKKYRDEPRGANKKYWIKVEEDGKERTALYKNTETKINGTRNDHFGEKIYSDICNKILKIPVAKIELVKKDGIEGCISYNVLEDIAENDGTESDRFILIDMATLIQRIRPDFDKDYLKVKSTEECFSLDLIMEALRNACTINGELDKDEFDALKRYVVNTCLVDSVLEYTDRHALNLSVAQDKKTGKLIPIELYDNGLCLHLDATKQTAEKCLKSNENLDRIREQTISKVGLIHHAGTKFDILQDVIFNHFFDEAEPLAKKMESDLTADKLIEILSDPDYSTLDNAYKKLIITEIIRNRDKMHERYKRSKNKNAIEHTISSKEHLNRDLINYSIRKSFENDGEDYKEKILDEEDFDIIEELENVPQDLLNGKVHISKDTINNIKWVIIYSKMCEAVKADIPISEKKEMVEENLMNSFNFLKEDVKNIEALSELYNYTHNYTNNDIITLMIVGIDDPKNGISISNLDEFLAMKYAKMQVLEKRNNNSDARKDYEELEKMINDVLEKEKFLSELPPETMEKINSKLRLADKLEEKHVLYNAIDKIQEENIVFNNDDELSDFMVDVAKALFRDKKAYIGNKFIDCSEIKEISENSKELPDGKKIFITGDKITHIEEDAFLLGIDYVVKIKGEREKGKPKSVVGFAKKGNRFPDGVISYLDGIKTEISKRHTKIETESMIKHKVFNSNTKAEEIFSIFSGTESKEYFMEDASEIEEKIFKSFEGRQNKDHEDRT